MRTKELFLDLETTGLESNRHAIVELAAVACVNGSEVGRYQKLAKPGHFQDIQLGAIEVSGNNIERLLTLGLTQEGLLTNFRRFLGCFINKYDTSDKFKLIGYNVYKFDEPFLRTLFQNHGDNYYGSWFRFPPIDVMLLAGIVLPKLKSYKLSEVAKHLGIQFEESELHSAIFDTELTLKVYRKLQEIGWQPLKT